MEPFALNPEGILERIHPRARKYFDDWIAKIYQEVPELVGIDEAQLRTDAATYLSNDERTRFNKCPDDVAKWLSKCIDITDNLSECLYGFEAMEPMIQFKYLLKMIYIRKDLEVVEEQLKRVEEAEAKRKDKEAQEQAEQEKKKKDEEWDAAYKAVKPPLDDAKKYLDEGEHKQYIQALGKAIRCYLEEGADEYLDDYQTFDYRLWLEKINNRKDEEARRATAQSQAREYNKCLNREVVRLKKLLCHNEKDHADYFKEQVNDPRYLGYHFNHVLTDEYEQTFDKSIVSSDKREVDKLVPEDFRQFIDSECLRSFFLLPSVDYSSNGVPCLDFTFDVFAVVKTRIWLKPGPKSFSGYTFQFPWRGEKGRGLVQEPEFLGYNYHILTPSDFDFDGYVAWQRVPLVLLKGLLSGETKPAGVTISAASDGLTTYKIPKFKDEVNIPDSFAEYMRNIGSIDGMLSMGIITKKVAGIARGELGQLRSGQKPSEGKVKGSQKAMAYRLFDEGKDATSPEVKALGLRKSTRFKYHNLWQKQTAKSK